ncbi:hypothetical protein SAY86_025071 [Trapa natans]|uniref:Uncharacterized protein n=1 Tax=Trapa natans TaxID=22666 RepID=A0AAN7M764_TRANT|nr:hypothetical protein SAY86_025071 [Trapa natans]
MYTKVIVTGTNRTKSILVDFKVLLRRLSDSAAGTGCLAAAECAECAGASLWKRRWRSWLTPAVALKLEKRTIASRNPLTSRKSASPVRGILGHGPRLRHIISPSVAECTKMLSQTFGLRGWHYKLQRLSETQVIINFVRAAKRLKPC